MKTKTKQTYTLGPWDNAEKLNTDGKEVGITAKHPTRPGMKYTLATVHEGFSGEEKANASLIAAAPELLEALNNLKGYVEEAMGSMDAGNFSREDVSRILNFIKQDLSEFGHAGKAIAKAEGR